jgi:putative heme iron utilization protein
MSDIEAHVNSPFQQQLLDLLEYSPTLSLATINSNNAPSVSLVPFLFDQDVFWIFVSHLSGHTQDLLQRPSVSILICDQQVVNPFAVPRVSLACYAEPHKGDADVVLDGMTVKLGETVTLLRQLADFTLFSLKPINGRLIAGFGQAFDIDFPSMLLMHVGPN